MQPSLVLAITLSLVVRAVGVPQAPTGLRAIHNNKAGVAHSARPTDAAAAITVSTYPTSEPRRPQQQLAVPSRQEESSSNSILVTREERGGGYGRIYGRTTRKVQVVETKQTAKTLFQTILALYDGEIGPWGLKNSVRDQAFARCAQLALGLYFPKGSMRGKSSFIKMAMTWRSKGKRSKEKNGDKETDSLIVDSRDELVDMGDRFPIRKPCSKIMKNWVKRRFNEEGGRG